MIRVDVCHQPAQQAATSLKGGKVKYKTILRPHRSQTGAKSFAVQHFDVPYN
jgi:hypothetical protein